MVSWPSIIRQDRFDGQIELPVELQDVVVRDSDRRLGLFGDVQEAEGLGAISVDHRVQIDAAEAFERADHR